MESISERTTKPLTEEQFKTIEGRIWGDLQKPTKRHNFIRIMRYYTILIGGGKFLLRVGDSSRLKINDLVNPKGLFTILEEKSEKPRKIKVSEEIAGRYTWIKGQLLKLDPGFDLDGPVINSSKRYVFRLAKEIFEIYASDLDIRGHESSHAFRKTGARMIYEKFNGTGNVLELLRKLLNHSNLDYTRIYIGIEEEEILDLYDLVA